MTGACFLLLSATILGQAVSKTESPTAAELIAKVPALDSGKERSRNLELVGRLKDADEFDLKFRAVYRATGESSFLLCDGTDNTPLMFVAGRRALLYDPVGPVVYRSNSATFVIGSETNGDQSRLLFGVGASNDRAPGHIYFDLRNLLKTHARSEVVTHMGGTTYCLTRIFEEGDRKVYYFDLSRPCPVKRIEMFSKDAKEPEGYFDIILDGTIKDDEFAFPDEKSIAEIIPVKTLPANSFLATAGGLFASMRACYVRMAAHHPAARDSLKFPGLLGINWNQVQQNDAKFAGAMRDLIPKAARAGLTPDASRAEVFQVRPEDLFAPRLLQENAGSPRP